MFAAVSGIDIDASEGPIPGKLPTESKKVKGPDYSDVVIKYLVANGSDMLEMEFLEKIMTRSLRTQAKMEKPGDIIVIREDQTFDKEGNYLIAVKYAEKIEPETPGEV